MIRVRKARLRDELLAHLGEALDAARAAHQTAIEGSTHPESKAENAKDTRGLEQSYLARGQARRVAELEAELVDVTAMALRDFAADAPISVGALVTAREGDEERRYLVAPGGGGRVLADRVHVVTPASPLGRALLGKRAGDVVEVALGGRTRELELVEVA